MNSEILKIRIYRERSFFMLNESDKSNIIKEHAFHPRYYLSFTNNASLQELTETVVPRCLQNRCSLEFRFENVDLQENT